MQKCCFTSAIMTFTHLQNNLSVVSSGMKFIEVAFSVFSTYQMFSIWLMLIFPPCISSSLASSLIEGSSAAFMMTECYGGSVGLTLLAQPYFTGQLYFTPNGGNKKLVMDNGKVSSFWCYKLYYHQYLHDIHAWQYLEYNKSKSDLNEQNLFSVLSKCICVVHLFRQRTHASKLQLSQLNTQIWQKAVFFPPQVMFMSWQWMLWVRILHYSAYLKALFHQKTFLEICVSISQPCLFQIVQTRSRGLTETFSPLTFLDRLNSWSSPPVAVRAGHRSCGNALTLRPVGEAEGRWGVMSGRWRGSLTKTRATTTSEQKTTDCCLENSSK